MSLCLAKCPVSGIQCIYRNRYEFIFVLRMHTLQTHQHTYTRIYKNKYTYTLLYVMITNIRGRAFHTTRVSNSVCVWVYICVCVWIHSHRKHQQFDRNRLVSVFLIIPFGSILCTRVRPANPYLWFLLYLFVFVCVRKQIVNVSQANRERMCVCVCVHHTIHKTNSRKVQSHCLHDLIIEKRATDASDAEMSAGCCIRDRMDANVLKS